MKAKYERLEISVSVLATEEIDDDEALGVAKDALMLAVNHMTDRLPCRRFVSSVGIGEGLTKRYTRRRNIGERRKTRTSVDEIDLEPKTGKVQ